MTYREEAEKHWHYTEQILLQELEQKHYFYVEAMVHGYGHGYEKGYQQAVNDRTEGVGK